MGIAATGDSSLHHVYQDSHRFETPRCVLCSSVCKLLGDVCNPKKTKASNRRGRRKVLTPYNRWQGMQLDHVLHEPGHAADDLRERYLSALTKGSIEAFLRKETKVDGSLHARLLAKNYVGGAPHEKVRMRWSAAHDRNLRPRLASDSDVELESSS